MHLIINPFSDCSISVKLFTFLLTLAVSLWGPPAVLLGQAVLCTSDMTQRLYAGSCVHRRGTSPLRSLPCHHTPRLLKAREVFRLGCWLLLAGLGQCSWIMKTSASHPHDFTSFLWED